MIEVEGMRRVPGIPGKSEFPQDWDDDTIISSILDVAHYPDWPPELQNHGTWKIRGVRSGVLIEVIVEPQGQIITGAPVSGPGVVKNPKPKR